MAKYYYGDLLLPAPPADVLAEYPYAWIRKRPDMDHYQLIFSKNPWYYSGGEIRSSGTSPLYAVYISTASQATEWAHGGNHSSSYPVNDSKPCIWSNCDIPNGSLTATDIYFYGSALRIEEAIYQINSNRLTAIADGFRSSRGTTKNYSLDEMAALAAEPLGSDPVIQPLSVTENGTYTPPEGVDGYSPVTVNVDGGGGENADAPINPVASLEVEKTSSSSMVGDVTYDDNHFVLLDIYPTTNGVVKITYGGLTKTIADTSGAEEPEPQQVFFGKFNGETDIVETPDSGTLTIEGDYRGYGIGSYTGSKSGIEHYSGISGVNCFGNPEMIPAEAFMYTGIDGLLEFNNKLKKIGEYAFWGCEYVNGVIFEGDILEIGNYAFSGNCRIQVASFRGKVGHIGEGAFDNAAGMLLLAEFKGDVDSVHNNAFTNPVVVTFNGTVKNIGDYGFGDNGMTGPTCVVMASPVPPVSVGEYPFGGATTIFVPTGTGDAYTNAVNGANYQAVSIEEVIR